MNMKENRMNEYISNLIANKCCYVCKYSSGELSIYCSKHKFSVTDGFNTCDKFVLKDIYKEKDMQ